MSFQVNDPETNKLNLIKWALNSKTSVFLFTPYLSNKGVQFLQNALNGKDVHLLIRGESNDFKSGAVEKLGLHTALELGWKVRYNTKLHAKSFFDTSGWMLAGSANLSSSGFSLQGYGNFEITFTGVDTDQTFTNAALTLFSKSPTVDLKFIRSMPDKVEAVMESPHLSHGDSFTLLDIPQSKSLQALHAELISEGYKNLSNQVLFHDCALLNINSTSVTLTDLYAAFNELPLTKKFLERVGNGEFFGALRRWLTDNVTEVPTPSREDFNQQLNKLYALTVEANAESYTIDVPGERSNRLKKIS